MKENKYNFLSDTDKDITDDELDNILVPFNKNIEKFMAKYIVPEIIAFSISNAYYRGALCKASLLIHYNSFNDVLNIFPSLDEVKQPIIEILNIKYNLTITNENPLELEKWNK